MKLTAVVVALTVALIAAFANLGPLLSEWVLEYGV